MATDRGVEAIN